MVGMDMGLEQPFELEAVLSNECDDRVGRFVGDAAGGIVDVHDGVDDRRRHSSPDP